MWRLGSLIMGSWLASGAMRSMGGFGRFLAIAGAGLAVAGCGPAAYRAGGAGPANAVRAASRAGVAMPAAREAVAATPRALAARSPATAAQRLLRYGNPDGHRYVPAAGRAVSTARPDHVIGHGTPAGCTSAAVVRAVAKGGIITFSCGPGPVTITMQATAKVVNTSAEVVLDGGGKVTLSGGGERRILYMDTCDPGQQWTTSHCQDQSQPRLVVQNMRFIDGNSTGQTFDGGGGGAIFDRGGQLAVINSSFLDNRCDPTGPDLGGAAIRALSQFDNLPVYIVHSTFRGGVCSNGGALSSIGVSWVVLNSVITGNQAI